MKGSNLSKSSLLGPGTPGPSPSEMHNPHHVAARQSWLPWNDPGQVPAPALNSHLASGYMRPKEVLRLLPFSAATLWRKVKDRSFIQPVKLSPRITAFSRSEVYAWLAQQGGQK